jgi:hypothetical protein
VNKKTFKMPTISMTLTLFLVEILVALLTTIKAWASAFYHWTRPSSVVFRECPDCPPSAHCYFGELRLVVTSCPYFIVLTPSFQGFK